ncbi:FtsQ-type POTRA domain-containing protein [Litorivicinus lipolyticus]|uniref:Cell division protein FtsQ n=1 Tax=Litorivicinus lipolyticus TaxID=418701 RepID=A0A5Q2QEZ4_9GAMM|nr:FtsQ-type POTRA domain-containing protein [Litorivicinus lipolyticus]
MMQSVNHVVKPRNRTRRGAQPIRQRLWTRLSRPAWLRLPRLAVPSLTSAWGLVLCLCAAISGAGVVMASERLLGDFVIERVEVEGDFVHLRPGDVQRRLDDLLVNARASSDLSQIQRQLSAQPWIAEVRVRRVWPHALRIEVIEQRPVARWNSDQFLGMQGDLFEPARAPLMALPDLAGPRGMQRDVFERFQLWAERMAQSGLELDGVEFDVDRGWRLHTVGGLDIQLGRMDLEGRLTRFDQAWQLKLAQTPNLVRVDLRYPNGVSLGFEESNDG